MASNNPPYMTTPGTITKVLEKIKTASQPDRFTQDYLKDVLGFSGGNPKSFIPYAKRIGLLSSNGEPTELYSQFRNPRTSGAAIAQAVKIGYHDLFMSNEAAHKLNRQELTGLVMQVTGLGKDSSTLKQIVASFDALVKFANFDEKVADVEAKPAAHEADKAEELNSDNKIRLGLSYTFNLVLPKTADEVYFNALFRSLKQNLIRD